MWTEEERVTGRSCYFWQPSLPVRLTTGTVFPLKVRVIETQGEKKKSKKRKERKWKRDRESKGERERGGGFICWIILWSFTALHFHPLPVYTRYFLPDVCHAGSAARPANRSAAACQSACRASQRTHAGCMTGNLMTPWDSMLGISLSYPGAISSSSLAHVHSRDTRQSHTRPPQ